jgi:hypothetical protein
MMSVDVVKAATGAYVGRFKAQTAKELRDILGGILPSNCGYILLRGLEVLEPYAPLHHGETLSMIVEQHFEVSLVIKHLAAWAFTSPPFVPVFASDIAARQVVADYFGTDGLGDDSASLALLNLFAAQEVVWEVGEATHRGVEEPLGLVANATLVLVLAANRGPPPFLFIARSEEDLIALGVNNLPVDSDHHRQVLDDLRAAGAPVVDEHRGVVDEHGRVLRRGWEVFYRFHDVLYTYVDRQRNWFLTPEFSHLSGDGTRASP